MTSIYSSLCVLGTPDKNNKYELVDNSIILASNTHPTSWHFFSWRYIHQELCNNNRLPAKLFWGNINTFVFSIISQHAECTCSWNPFSWKTIHLPYTVCLRSQTIIRHCINLFLEYSGLTTEKLWRICYNFKTILGFIFTMGTPLARNSLIHLGQVTKLWLFCYLVLLSIDSKTR